MSVAQGENTQQVECDCGQQAVQAVSVPLGFGLYGKAAGWSKPSALKRHSYKTIDEKRGNRGFLGSGDR